MSYVDDFLDLKDWAFESRDREWLYEGQGDPRKAAADLAALRAENERLTKAVEEAQAFHPRAMKLIGKKKNFVVVAEDEEYFIFVYALIRRNEKERGTWSDEDEENYADCYRKITGEPTAEECRSEMEKWSKDE